MSVEAMAIALHHSKTTGAAKLVLIGIANHDGDGGAWPSVATLAKYAGMTGTPESNARAVRRILKKLAELGEITIERQAGGVRDMPDHERPNLYRITLTCPPGCDGTTKHRMERTPGLHNQGATGSTTPRGRVTQPSEPSSQPPSEPSVGSDDPWASQPAPHEASSRGEKKINGKYTEKEWARMQADFVRLRDYLLEIGDKTDPFSVYWTLFYEHDIKHPDATLRKMIDYGEWSGFVGRHGINNYLANGRAA